MMIACREASRLQSDSRDRPLRPRERLALQFHLLMCRACSRAERQLDLLRNAMAELGSRPDRDDASRK
jgi:hypothetical protein